MTPKGSRTRASLRSRSKTLKQSQSRGSGGSENPLVAIFLILTAMAVLPFLDGIAKYLSTRYPITEVVWARYMFHFLIILPILVWRFGIRSLWPSRVFEQILRSGLLLAATMLFFGALARMPLADTLALFFVSPLVVTAFAPLFLGEAVGLRRWLAVLTGFVGVCIIIRPGFAELQWGVLLALGAGVVHGFYLIATRKLAGSSPPLVTLAYTAVVGAVIMSVMVLPAWITPSPTDFTLMLLMGLIAATGHFLIIKAFDHASAPVLAPLGYSEIIMATVVGYLWFGDFPDLWSWIGIAIIIASGIYISFRERRV